MTTQTKNIHIDQLTEDLVRYIGSEVKQDTAYKVAESVYDTLIDALGLDNDEVTSQATLTGDLGSESIDNLDIVFRLERHLDIKIDRNEFYPEFLSDIGSPDERRDALTNQFDHYLRTMEPGDRQRLEKSGYDPIIFENSWNVLGLMTGMYKMVTRAEEK